MLCRVRARPHSRAHQVRHRRRQGARQAARPLGPVSATGASPGRLDWARTPWERSWRAIELHHAEGGCSVRLLGWIEHRKRGASRAGDRRDW